MYYMTHKMRCGYDPEFSGGWKGKPVFCEADHGDDLTMTFGEPFAVGEITPPVKYSEDERELCIQWLDYIGNFTKTG